MYFMKKITLVALVLAFIFGLNSTAFAEGGKVRGEISDGPAYQIGILPFIG